MSRAACLVEERTDCPFGQRTSDLADLAHEGFPETLLGVDERFDRALFRFKQRLEAAEFFGVGDLRLPGVAMCEVPRFWTFGGLIPVTEGYGRIRVKEERVIRRLPERAQD